MGFSEDIKEAREELAAAQRALGSAKATKAAKLSEIDSRIKAVGKKLSRPLYKYGDIKVYSDRISFEGTAYRLDKNASAEVSASGVKLESSDNRTLYLTVSTADGTFVAKCNPEPEGPIRQLAADIANYAPNAERNTAMLQGQARRLEVQRDEVEWDYSATDACWEDIEAKQEAIDSLMASASQEELAVLAKSDRTKKLLKVAAIAVAVLIALSLIGGVLSGGTHIDASSTQTSSKQEQTSANNKKESGAKSSKDNSKSKSAAKTNVKGNNPLGGLKIYTGKKKGTSGTYAYVVANKKKTLGMTNKQFAAFNKYLKTTSYSWFTVDFGDGTGLYMPGSTLTSASHLDLDKTKSQKINGKVYGHIKLVKKNGKNVWKYVKNKR